MVKRDPRVDAYIGKAAEFARPILTHVRALVHEACPDVEETMKWSVPHFEYNGIICGMAAFKQHCNVIVWKAGLIPGGPGREQKGQIRNVRNLSDLPDDRTMRRLFSEVAKLNQQGVKAPRRTTPKKPVSVTAELESALRTNKKAAAAFEKFPPSHKREYAEWVGEAKGDETRQRRAATAVEWISEGKSRNWKYERR